jgi:hypothetical protein
MAYAIFAAVLAVVRVGGDRMAAISSGLLRFQLGFGAVVLRRR